MTLLYMDSFDANILAPIGGFDVGAGAMQDAGFFWKGGTINYYSFPEGYLGGRCFDVGSSNLTYAGSSIAGENATRIGFWTKKNTTGAYAGFNLVSLGPYRVSVSNTGNWSLSDGTNTMLAAYTGWDSTWRHVEFYAGRSGIMQLRINGILVGQMAGNPTADRLEPFLGSATALGNNAGYVYDHMYITDGPELEGSGIYGVAVVAGQDLYDSNNDGLQGCVIIEGQRYLTDRYSAVIGTQFDYANDRNLSQVIPMHFGRNPATGDPWTQTDYNSIEQWGVCYAAFGTSEEIRVTVIHLAVLKDSPGGPIIEAIQAGGVTSFSGNWRKTNENIPLSEHIKALPRSNETFRDDTPSLYVSEGCLNFPGPGIDPEIEPSITTLGLTFAEEFRQDYRDWVRVDGRGQSFDSMFVAGYSVLGEGNRKFQDNYVTVNYENVPTGTATIQGLWDYSENGNTGRWSVPQLINNKGGDYKHGHRRIKIRGHGKALSIRVTNNGDYPFVINGWTALVSSNQSV